MEEKKMKNNQLIRVDSKSGFVELMGNMFNESESNGKRYEGRVVINLQENEEKNGATVKKDSIAFFLELSKFQALAHDFLNGSLVLKGMHDKLDKIFEKIDDTAYTAENCEMIQNQYLLTRNGLNSANPDVMLKMTSDFVDMLYNSKHPLYIKPKKLVKKPMVYCNGVVSFMGGTSKARSKRADGCAEARILEIKPGSVSDWVLEAKSGKGIEDEKGAITMASGTKPEKIIRIPISHSDLKRIFLTVSSHIDAEYVRRALQN